MYWYAFYCTIQASIYACKKWFLTQAIQSQVPSLIKTVSSADSVLLSFLKFVGYSKIDWIFERENVVMLV